MKRSLLLTLFALFTVSVAALAQYSLQGTVPLPSSPLLTAVDPYAKPDRPNPLNPSRPYWYVADQTGLTILKLADNTVVGTIAWPATYDLAQPNGSFQNVPTPPAGWEPLRLMVPFPDSEGIGPEAVAGADFRAFVEMAHSGYEWQTSDGRFRDTIVANTNPDTESSMVLMIIITDPAKPAILAGALLGHDAGQMAWDPGAGAMYVANMPSNSLPPNLASFISKITAPEAGAEPAPPYAPMTLYPLCGPEVQWSGEVKEENKMGIPVNVPEVWACDTIHGAGEGEGPFEYAFTGLPAWLTAHLDKAGKPDGILYGTPTVVGTYTFVVTVTDLAAQAGDPITASAVVTIDVMPTVTEFAGGEMEVEAGTTTAVALWATADSTCATQAGDPLLGGTPVPAWFEVVTVPNGCVVLMNSPTLSGEYYDFIMPNLTRIDTRTGVAYPGPWEVSAEVLGTYGFDSLPADVGLSGLAWHEVDMIPGEPDKYVLNGEFIGVDAFTGQLYKDVLPYELSDTIEDVGPFSMVVETNEISTEGLPLIDTLKTARPEIGDTTGLKVFGDLVVEADRDIYVSVPINGATISEGAVIKVSGGMPSTIALPGADASYLALDSDLEPAVKPDLGGLGQIDHGFLWATGPNSGNVAVVDTALGASQTLEVAGAASLGGVAVDSVSTGLAYVAGQSLQNVTLFGSGTAWNTAPMIATINPAEAIVDPTVMTVGAPGLVTIIAIGWPIPALSVSGTVPGLTFADNGNGTLTVSGTPTAAGIYTLATEATNAAGATSQTFTLTVNPTMPPAITSASSATLTVGIAGQFKVEATGTPTPILTVSGALPAGVTFHDNAACSPAIPAGCTGSSFLGGLPTGSGTYELTITAANSEGIATQAFTLYVTMDVPTATPPLITTQPASRTVMVNETATFTSAATGIPTPTVQWQVLAPGADWSDILAATSTSYTTGPATTAMNGYQYRAMFTNAGGSVYSSNATLSVGDPAPAITSASETDFIVGSAGSFTVTATGAPTPTLSSTGTLPDGVTFVQGDGTATLAGTASAPGSYPIVITASNTLGSVTQNFTLKVQVMAVATTSLPKGMVTVAYSYQLQAVGGIQPYTWTLAPILKNTLPSGLSLSSSGMISGKPNKAGSYSFTVLVKDALKHMATRALALTLADVGGPLRVNLEAGSEPEGIAVNPVTHKAYILSRDMASGLKTVVVMDNAVLNAQGPPKKIQLPPGAAGHSPTLIPIANDHEYLAIDSTRNLIYVPTKYAAPYTPEAGEPPEENDEPTAGVLGTLTAIDGNTNAVLAFYEFPTGVMPEGVAVDPVNNVVYVAVKLPEPEDPGGCPIDPVSGQAECEMTGGLIYAFSAANVRAGSLGSPIAEVPAEEPESIVFDPTARLLYAADESKGTTTIFNAVNSNGIHEGGLMMPLPIFSTPGFPASGPNPYALPCSPYEADKMAVGADGSVYITDDKSRVAKITAGKVVGMAQIDLPGGDNAPLYCYGEEPLQGLNTANNIAFMKTVNLETGQVTSKLYVVSEQNTVSILDPATLTLKATVTVPGAVHLDAIAVDGSMNRVWITDEVAPEINGIGAVFVLQGRCANGTGPCGN